VDGTLTADQATRLARALPTAVEQLEHGFDYAAKVV
jgi:hypothetical protein